MTGEPKTFTVDGEIYSMQADPKPDPKDQCMCCRPLGHVFGYGVHVPSVTRPGITAAEVPGNVTDWIHDLLYRDYRRDGGRKVRITLEVLPDEAIADPVATVAECGYCTTRITLLGGDWLADDGGTTCTDASAPYVPHKPKAADR